MVEKLKISGYLLIKSTEKDEAIFLMERRTNIGIVDILDALIEEKVYLDKKTSEYKTIIRFRPEIKASKDGKEVIEQLVKAAIHNIEKEIEETKRIWGS